MGYLIKVLSSVSMSALQVEEYKAINKKTYKIIIIQRNVRVLSTQKLFNCTKNEQI